MRVFFGFFFLISVVFLPGCNNDIKEAIRERLKDPDSVKFEKILTQGTRACVEYNAKNSYGGYVGNEVAQLKDLDPSSGTHYVVESESKNDKCDASVLEEKLAIDAADATAHQVKLAIEQEKSAIELADKQSDDEVIDKLKASKLIPSTARSYVYIEDKKCRDFVENTMFYAHLANAEQDKKKKSEWQNKYNAGLAIIESGRCGKEQSTTADAAGAADAATE